MAARSTDTLAQPSREMGQRIASRRKTLGISQAQLAKDLAVSQSTVAEWESGKNRPRLRTIKALLVRFRCSIEDLDPAYESRSTSIYSDELLSTPSEFLDKLEDAVFTQKKNELFLRMFHEVHATLHAHPEVLEDEVITRDYLTELRVRIIEAAILIVRAIWEAAELDARPEHIATRVGRQMGRFSVLVDQAIKREANNIIKTD